MPTVGWPHPFRSSPWDEIAAIFDELAAREPGFEHMKLIVDSVISSGSTALLAGCTSMHDLLVVPLPMPEPPLDVVAVRAPGSLGAPRTGDVVIEHLSHSGKNDRIARPVADAVPLFWRFLIVKFGVHPVAPPPQA